MLDVRNEACAVDAYTASLLAFADINADQAVLPGVALGYRLHRSGQTAAEASAAATSLFFPGAVGGGGGEGASSNATACGGGGGGSNRGAVALLGPPRSEQFAAVGAICAGSKRPCVAATVAGARGWGEAATPFSVRAGSLVAEADLAMAAQLVRSFGWSTALVLSTDSATDAADAAMQTELLAAVGVTVVDTVTIRRSAAGAVATADARVAMARLRASKIMVVVMCISTSRMGALERSSGSSSGGGSSNDVDPAAAAAAAVTRRVLHSAAGEAGLLSQGRTVWIHAGEHASTSGAAPLHTDGFTAGAANPWRRCVPASASASAGLRVRVRVRGWLRVRLWVWVWVLVWVWVCGCGCGCWWVWSTFGNILLWDWGSRLCE